MASVRVAVRVRPLNKREKLLSSKVIICMKGNTTSVLKMKFSPNMRDGVKDTGKNFTYDFSYDSSDRESPNFITQEKIFKDLGSDILKSAFEGFNACVFAYGQTGTGKSYTMMGDTGDKGLIPRICEGLFHEIAVRNESDAMSFHTEVSYLEIYNERVQDLLKKAPTSKDGGGLRVREHSREGPYVENLSKHVVLDYNDIEELMTTGNGNRTTASTGMNDASSRSHAIFTLNFTQALFDADLPRETLSKIHLVDLAGSERADATRATGSRLKEGANINKSLVTLGNVISALADLCEAGLTNKKKQVFIPYRDSVLTWLLKDSLGGNAKTIMIATISPADVNYGETLSTLRYASRAKNIMNTPTVNEDGSCKVIRELQAEIVRLRGLVEQADQAPNKDDSSNLRVEVELHQNEAKVLRLTKEWTNKWGETEDILKEETLALRKEGSGVVLDSLLPHLIGIDEDLLGPGIILYHLKEGRTLVGNDEGSCCRDIVLRGPGLLNEHCVLENCAGTVRLIPQRGALCFVNGMEVMEPCQLTQGAMIQLGKGTVFRFNHPAEATQLREKRKNRLLSSFSLSMTDLSKSTENLAKVMLLNPGRRMEKQESPDIKRLADPSEDSGAPCQRRVVEEVTHVGRDAEVVLRWPTVNPPSEQHQPLGDQRMDVLTEVNAESKLPGRLPLPPSREVTMAIAEQCPVSHSSCELDGDALLGGGSTRDGRERKRDASHKSGSGAASKNLWRTTEAEAGSEHCGGGKGWSRDASLQQTSVLGPGDGCGAELEGDANESQGVVADCCKGRPDSGGSSLGSVSHLQSAGGTTSTSILPQVNARSPSPKKSCGSQAARSPPKEDALEGSSCCGEMDEHRGLKRNWEQCEAEAMNEAEQTSRLGSLVNRVSWMFQDAGRLLWRSPRVLPLAIGGLQPVGARWSRQVLSLVRESQVLAVVKDSQVFSLIRESHVFSLVKDSRMLTVVNELPLIQHFHMALTKALQTGGEVEDINSLKTLTLSLTQSSAMTIALTQEPSLIQGEDRICKGELELPEQDVVDIHFNQGRRSAVEGPTLPERCSCEPGVTFTGVDNDAQSLPTLNVTPELCGSLLSVEIFCQKLVEFPAALASLQSMSLHSLVDTLQPLIPTSVFSSQKTVALYWLSVAKCSQPQLCPALVILMESGLYTVTSDLGSLVLFHYLPLLYLMEVQVGLAGQSLRLMGGTEESILGLYTCSQALTKELCRAVLAVLCPGDSRVFEHPLLGGDLMEMSLDLKAYIPDLLLDAGLRICCDFQKTLADLIYLLHCNMGDKRSSIAEVRLLLYTTVRVCISPDAEYLAQFLLTDTHLGLVQEDTVFHPPPRSIPLESRVTRFQHVTLRWRTDLLCVMVHSADRSGVTRLDLILPRVAARGHPERVAAVAVTPPQASNSSPQTEVWKLTFSCSAEAACLINHLSNV